MDKIKLVVKLLLQPYFEKHELEEDTDLFATGEINSLFAMQIVMMIESEFNITLEGEDLDFENFKSIRSLSNLVGRKQNIA